ncbi:MAG: hypothetical protein IK066_07420 [Kiritimatiellae bacterium]|nr:hypothetical protein [Kiritimatiellia bacterium]
MNSSFIIGCGGAGIAAMREAVRLLAFRKEKVERVACLAVDGEMAALDCFGEWLLDQKEFWKGTDTWGCGPCVRMVCAGRGEWAEGMKALRGASGAEKERLQEHWWFDGDGRPFLGLGIPHVRGAAWASPTDAYGATWMMLPYIQRTVSDLLGELARRDPDNPEPLRNLRVYVVAGLAGTTGRGSWNLVAEKVRECLRNIGVRVMPVAVLFGADVYKHVGPGAGPRFWRDAQVNALTGISELSGWLENGHKGGKDCVAWRLPDMRRPDEQGRTDVLCADASADSCGGPVGRAYLVCGSSPEGRLESPQAYQRMAGKALYAMAEDPENPIRHLNDLDCYGSLAGATFEVDAVHIQAFCETLARELVLGRLAKTSRRDERAVEEAIGELWAECPLDAPRNAEEFLPNPQGTLWQRVAHAAMETEEWQREFKGTRDALAKCTVNQAEEVVLPLEHPRWVLPLMGAMEETLRKTGLRAAVEEASKRMICGDDGEGPSPARAVEFLGRLRKRIAAARSAAPERLEMDTVDGGKAAPEDAVRDWLRECGKRRLVDVLMAKRPYGQEELDWLCCPESPDGRHWRGIIPRGVLAAMYPVIRKRIDVELAGVLESIDKKMAACQAVLGACWSVRSRLAAEEGAAAGGGEGDNGFELLYATPDRIDETLYTGDNPRRLYHRVLKPIVECRGEVESLVAGETRVGERFMALVDRALDIAAGGGEARADALEGEFADAVMKEVFLAPGFLERHYAFLRVLENNLPHWNRAIAETADDNERQMGLFYEFRLTLGAEPQFDDYSRKYELPSVGELRWTIAESLVSVCRQWWIANTSGREREGVVFVPFNMHSNDSDRLNAALHKAGMSGEFNVIGVESGRGTPYAYVSQAEETVYMTAEEKSEGIHPLDKVLSLDGWREPEVLKTLLLAEREDGAAIFGKEGCTPGVGYVSPLYVRNERLSGCRWKPWATEPRDA